MRLVYALNLAKSIAANILLCNAIKVPANAPMAAQVAWPLVDYNTLQEEVTREFEQLTEKIQEAGPAKNLPAYPIIQYKSLPGSVSVVVKNLFEKEKACLVVMGLSGEGAISRFFLEATVRN